jgi:hypothetical protein
MPEKRTVPQAVFDSPQALKAAREGHRQACEELEAQFQAGGPFDEGNPNHPMYSTKLLFGYPEKVFLAKQYR